jgi:hypothetical protein
VLLISSSSLSLRENPRWKQRGGCEVAYDGVVRSDGWDMIGRVLSTVAYHSGTYTPYPTDITLSHVAAANLGIASTDQGVLPLPARSQAIDAITDGTCLTSFDHRGVVRPQDGNGDGGPACAIGVYEFVFTGAAAAPAQPQPP